MGRVRKERMSAASRLGFSPTSIESEYRRLGQTLGWRFFTCPEGNLDKASVALVTINPAGGAFEPAKWSVEEGSAYEVERWKGCEPGQEKLQRQVRRMFEVMGVDPKEVMSGYLVPFRSPEWDLLPRQKESLEFGVGLWRRVFELARARTVVAFGKDTAPHLRKLLDARLVFEHATDWGGQTIDEHRFGPDGRLVVLSHLSRFRLFGRPPSEAAFLSALGHDVEAPSMPAARSTPAAAGAVIRILVAANPKRGKSRLRFDCYRDGMTAEEYERTVRERLGAVESAKCRDDLKWDSDPKRALIRIERS